MEEAKVITSLESSTDKPLSDEYLEESKDVDTFKISYDDDDDETVCRMEDDDLDKPVIEVE